MMQLRPRGLVLPPPRSGAPYVIVVIVAPPLGMILANPIGLGLPPPRRVTPCVTLVVVAPGRRRRHRGRPRRVLRHRRSCERQHQYCCRQKTFESAHRQHPRAPPFETARERSAPGYVRRSCSVSAVGGFRSKKAGFTG